MEVFSAEKKAGSAPTPEFTAKSRFTGKTYSVEAKRKNSWKSATDSVSNNVFIDELKHFVRNKIYASAKKRLDYAIYWIELSIPTLINEEDWRFISERVGEAVRDAEQTMTFDGEPIGPAYVVVTNHTFLANEDVKGHPCFGFLETIRIDDYPFGREIELEAALEGYDKHRDVFWLMEAWKTAHTVPTSFDGTPPELLDSEGRAVPTVKIGDVIEVVRDDGNVVPATVEEIASLGSEEAVLAVTDGETRWLVKMPLTAAEAQAAERFTDAIFGKANITRNLKHDDPFELYEWFKNNFANMTSEQVCAFFEREKGLQHFAHLPLDQARIRIAREHTKAIWLSTQLRRAELAKSESA